ncbi:MAG: hypothetical protein NC913_09855 [Candidatus Omnitrophica bacterium]|nr:hypothetical protein [Candidatus Omnitrophota bacterium]
MKKICIFLFVVIFVSMLQAKVNVITKSIVVYPEKEAGKIARIVFNTDTPGSFLFIIKDAKGNIVRTLSTGKINPGQAFVDWDGRDFSGNVVGEGEYSVSIVTGISWVPDEKFGKNGKIGLETMEIKVVDPEKITFKVPGEIKKITVGETEYYKTDNLSIAGPNYIIKEGNVQINPTGGAKKDDIVRVEYYDPFYLENPWALDVDEAGNLYVLYRWKTESMQYPATTLVKITPDGKKIVDDFGNGGKIGPFSGHASQVIVNEKEGRIYIAATHDSGHSTGVFSLKTGAFLYAIGGWFEGGKSPKTTRTPAGIVLGSDNKIYIRGFIAYDRTKEKDKGFLYGENPIAKRHSGYPPLIDNYWGPSMESCLEPDCFYASAYQSDIAKIKDTGTGFAELYHIYLNGSPVGMSFDTKTGLLFAALRTLKGEVGVLHDTGVSLNEMWRLKDNDLGPTHSVKIKGDYLYVIEDGISPVSRIFEAMKKANIEPLGKNRISRYKINFEQENDVCKVSVKK